MASTQKQKTASGGSVTGSLNTLLSGWLTSDAWYAITSGFPPLLPVFVNGFLCRVPNKQYGGETDLSFPHTA